MTGACNWKVEWRKELHPAVTDIEMRRSADPVIAPDWTALTAPLLYTRSFLIILDYPWSLCLSLNDSKLSLLDCTQILTAAAGSTPKADCSVTLSPGGKQEEWYTSCCQACRVYHCGVLLCLVADKLIFALAQTVCVPSYCDTWLFFHFSFCIFNKIQKTPDAVAAVLGS